jgi:hypothetical protein
MKAIVIFLIMSRLVVGVGIGFFQGESVYVWAFDGSAIVFQ